MTFQVGMCGSDGVLLASDRRITFDERGALLYSAGSKIIIHPNDVVCCYAGDVVAQYAADMMASLTPGANLRSVLKEIGETAWIKRFGNEEKPTIGITAFRRVMVAIDDQLWVLDISRTSVAQPIEDKYVTGDSKNTARLYANLFYPGRSTPVHDLCILAAHMVLSAGIENKQFVGDGVEIALAIGGKKPIFLPAEEIQQLTEQSTEITNTLRKMLLPKMAATSPQKSKRGR